MNSIMTEYYPTFQMYQALRVQLMDSLTDEDLRYSAGGENAAAGRAVREIGETEHAYIQSFKTFTIDFSYRNPEPGLETSVARLTAWFQALDAELEATIAALSEEDVKTRQIDRGGWCIPPLIQLEIYKEALLIFYGKVSVYLKAMGSHARSSGSIGSPDRILGHHMEQHRLEIQAADETADTHRPHPGRNRISPTSKPSTATARASTR